jgi:DNA-binding FadR family transcriptional regulator
MGYLEKQSYRGRTITPAGQAVILQANSLQELDFYKSNLDEVISSNVLENYLMVLEARQAIERESARLAAQRITDKELESLSQCLENQEEQIKNHKSIASVDVAFHSGIAKASKNEVLFSLYRIISTMGQQSPLFEKLRQRVGDSYSDFHQKILKALRDRDPVKAEEYMMLHISRLKDDVNRYWHEYNLTHPARPEGSAKG